MTKSSEKHEIVCIRRHGLNMVGCNGADFAAYVVYQKYTPGQVFDPRTAVISEWLVPFPNYWGER